MGGGRESADAGGAALSRGLVSGRLSACARVFDVGAEVVGGGGALGTAGSSLATGADCGGRAASSWGSTCAVFAEGDGGALLALLASGRAGWRSICGQLTYAPNAATPSNPMASARTVRD